MFSEKFLHYFPPPKFLDIPCAGLSISDSFVRMIEFEKDTKGELKIKKYAEKELPKGAIVAGRLNNREEIIHTLEALRKETGIEKIRVSIPEEKAYLFETTIPLVPPKEVRNAIEFKLEENVPLPANDVLFDYAIISQDKKDDRLKVVVSALPSKFVDIYMDLLNSAGLIPYSLQIESQAIVRALLSKKENKTYVILHFASEKAGVYVVSCGVVRFTHTVRLSLDWNENVSTVLSEMQKVIAYWRDNKIDVQTDGVGKIAGVIVCGDSFPQSMLPHLSSMLRLDVVLGNVWQNAFDIKKGVPKIDFFDSLKYASAVGLALSSEFLV